jgi:hypothetical protein
VPDNTIFNTAELVEFMQKYRVTEILFTPSLAETLLATTQNVSIQIPTLQVVWLNGEVGNKLAAAAANLSLVQVVTSKLLETCEQKMPRVRVFNTIIFHLRVRRGAYAHQLELIAACKVAATELRHDPSRQSGTVGHVAKFASHLIMDTQSHTPVQERHQPGELWVSGRGIDPLAHCIALV